jgi:hypothetical protein
VGPDGLPLPRGEHPVGRQIKDILGKYDESAIQTDPGWLNEFLQQVRDHARRWSALHPATPPAPPADAGTGTVADAQDRVGDEWDETDADQERAGESVWEADVVTTDAAECPEPDAPAAPGEVLNVGDAAEPGNVEQSTPTRRGPCPSRCSSGYVFAGSTFRYCPHCRPQEAASAASLGPAA